MASNLISIADSVCYKDSCRYTLECENEAIPHLVTASFHRESSFCIANGNKTMLNLSHFTRNSNDSNGKTETELAEDYSLEFDNNISALCFDPTGACVIVGDTSGYLHFVTSSGSLIFSHQISSSGM